jgi:hypothetical protein
MKVIFLDVDGVLNIISDSYKTTAQKDENGHFIHLEKHLLKRLEYLIKETGAKIVVSSSWRLDIENLREKLKKANFSLISEIYGLTGLGHTRGEEIKAWINKHKPTKYVVLEDEIFDVCGEKCDVIPEENVVEVDHTVGLTDKDVKRAIAILGK